jgi:2,3,4,5-tetrahydropyridine-2-carboxylate N-succinyltransferase
MIHITTRPAETLKPVIEAAVQYAIENPKIPFTEEHRHAIEEVMGMIDRGRARIASPGADGNWTTHAWLKNTIMLYFRMQTLEESSAGPLHWVDKIPLKRWEMKMGVRVVPPATVRFGAFVGTGSVIMPSYINIGAYVGEGTMVDTWATVGSCAQIGRGVHLSGGVGIGGVLEPAQAQPVIIEDDCFIGSRCIVVEGVHVKAGAVLGAGVTITKSTSIVDARTGQISKGVIPANSVVIPGTMPKKFPGGEFGVPCALIIGQRTESTDRKVSLNQALRDFEVPV